MNTKKILVVCDDLTGCGDVAYWGFDSGMRQKICDLCSLDKTDFAGFEIIIVNTESRFDDRKTADRKLEYISEWAKTKDFGFIFKKIDSTLRGNFVAEIDVLIKNFGIKYLPFVAAYPEYGRNTVNGFQYVNDKLLHETEFAKDPKNPVTESHIAAMLKKQSKFFEVYNVYDVETDSDFVGILKNITFRYENCDNDQVKVFAGTAKFFGEILNANFGSIACHPVENCHCKSLHFHPAHFFFHPEQGEGSRFFTSFRMTQQTCDFQNLLVIAGSFNLATKKQLDNFYYKFSLGKIEENENYVLASNNKNMYVIESPRQILQDYCLSAMIEKAKELLAKLGLGYEKTLLILTGGDTAYKFCKSFGIFDIEVIAKIDTGIMLCGDIQKKVCFVLKSGGFGDEEFLVRIGMKTIL